MDNHKLLSDTIEILNNHSDNKILGILSEDDSFLYTILGIYNEQQTNLTLETCIMTIISFIERYIGYGIVKSIYKDLE
ncbi:hypothetical protein [Rummeliibacillus stabekisii]|uniref:hypothetical protein n=1 Tax=Rummeliibacillus stabekisii TaxID=241244 RepID=UPI00203D4B27|nr:hypothetical protein [Rummeliibacillus stabekisii]